MKEGSLQQRLQHSGRFLSAMVMPNIGAFIAWGLITALFIPTGWLPNESLSALVSPMILYLLPLLIGFTGGQLVGGTRGAVVGAVATMGIVVGVDIPMFIGAMIMGPIGGLLIKKIDELVDGNIPNGFEMLVNNFSAGITAMGLALLSYVAIGPVVLSVNRLLETGVGFIVEHGLLPLTALFIEPGKILFLNNAINHGVLGPLGIAESAEYGKSIFFLLETNPGPGLGILLAYWLFGKGVAKQSSPGAMIIHFLGGIHEIYFPYVLMKPSLLLAVIAGGIGGIGTYSILGTGLVATPSPGSIFALLAMAPRGSQLSVILGVLVATSLSFIVAAFLLKNEKTAEDTDFEDAKASIESKKRVSKNLQTGVSITESVDQVESLKLDTAVISKIRFACDAGMGSSAMGASKLTKRLKEYTGSFDIGFMSIDQLTGDEDLVITHKVLQNRAHAKAPDAQMIGVVDFLTDPQLDDLVVQLIGASKMKTTATEEIICEEFLEVLSISNVKVNLASESKEDAIRRAGNLLVDLGYAKSDYITGMLNREEVTTTYIGSSVAIPHGTNETKHFVNQTGLVILQYPDGIDFGDGNVAHLVIGIAAIGDEHMMILSNIAESISNEETLAMLINTASAQEILNRFSVFA
ncbi:MULTISPECIES: PTS mannitol transporter subunit IICBA [unclassified Fusibacter]|uniref:PTS mannitol transporter subunit IICBA n=1 Tax=unclassified Fusibacter TaxID=2624464 RepID=UPI00101139CD|nr:MULTISPECIES: PTS mannitol transporter subunit IICBA [unclassified Fusibacter]MCK8058583.1 PTS mannitol transporter subunit IICBA [Fusibacter sp. A2]NPE22647.1 PTS mannitol transporter subunit IICBA [Fusibacter sp. A1]RXV60211.1 PTS mannitol transporter subunit IICBA [Fusibacter sp. A1]